MKLSSREELAEYLVRKWDYVPAQAPETADELLKLDPAIRHAFELWLDNGEFPEAPVYVGLSPKSLNKLVSLKPPAIFLLLDWIRREPAEAMQAVQQELIGKQRNSF